jgi:hypothetical protein
MSERPIAELSPPDQQILDRLVECGFDISQLSPMTPQERQRAQAVLRVFHLLNDYPVQDADESLVHAALARIDRYEDQHAAKMKIAAAASAPATRVRLIRWGDFVSVAAVLLIAAGVAWPVLGRVRDLSLQTACSNNLRTVGQGFSAYASDYRSAMPVSQVAGFAAGASFGWDTARNIDNLAPMIEAGYCEHGHFNCPGHRHGGPSYSYQLQLPGIRAAWGAGRAMVILGDRNPLVDAARVGRTAAPLTLSTNHGQKGQNVLQDDGAVFFMLTPTIGLDNIWLPAGVIELQRGDRQREPRDVFLVH